LADVETQYSVICRTPGALFQALAAWLIQECELSTTTLITPGSWVIPGTADTPVATIVLTWDDLTGLTHADTLNLALAWMCQNESGHPQTFITDQYIAISPGASARLTINKLAPGAQTQDPYDMVALCLDTLRNLYELLINQFGTGSLVPAYGGWTTRNDAMNFLCGWEFEPSMTGTDLVFTVWQCTVINAFDGEAIYDALADGWQGIPAQSLMPSQTQIVQKLSDIAMKEIDVQFNRGAVVTSIRSAVVSS
jgi:hypothetical protein